MSKAKSKTKVKDESDNLADKLNQFAAQTEVNLKDSAQLQMTNESTADKSDEEPEAEYNAAYDSLFEAWDEREFTPQDFMINVPVGSLESCVGYSSLFRQMHQAFVRQVAFHTSPEGGSLSSEEARAKAFHACDSKEEAKKLFREMSELPLEILNFVDLLKLQEFAPRVAERFWERAKREGRKEFESGHLAANITFPVGYMKGLWNIARYLGVRESFINDWSPKVGIEVAMIDMLAQSYFQWQYWLEQTVKRSQTQEREEHPNYTEWKQRREELNKAMGWAEGYWLRPYVAEQQAIEHAVQMADRFNRIFMRTLRQLRDLRRYSPVTINNPNQVNIATDGGQQVNVSNVENDSTSR
jgi:hypothetical protein